MRTVHQTMYMNTGGSVEVIDPKALQQELHNLETADTVATSRFAAIDKAIDELQHMRNEIRNLQAQVDATQMFYGYVTTHHKHIIDEYKTREAVKAKVCPPPMVQSDFAELELRTIAALAKLP